MSSLSESKSAFPRVPSIPLVEESPEYLVEKMSVGSLVRAATTQMSTLIRAEVELAKVELTREARKAAKGGIFFAVALTVLLFSSFFFFFFAAELLDIWLPRWSAFLIVFGVMLLTAIVFALLGVRKVRKLKAPERTISSAKETVNTLTHRAENNHDEAVRTFN